MVTRRRARRLRTVLPLHDMSTDAKWIIGTLGGLILTLAGLLSAQIVGVNARIDDANARIDSVNAAVARVDDNQKAAVARVDARLDELRSDLREDRAAFDARLRAVELAFGKVDQRLLTIERAVLPAPAPGE